MKKQRAVLMFCSILLLTLLFSGCGGEESKVSDLEEQLADSWYREGKTSTNREGGQSPEFTLYSDGTCEIATEYGEGTWAVVNDRQLKLTTFFGETETLKIISLKNGCLTLGVGESSEAIIYWNTPQELQKDSDSGSSDSGSSGDSGSSDSGSSSDPSGSEPGDGGVYAEEGYGEGRLGDVMHTYFFDFTINSAKLADSYGSFTPAEGNKVLVTEMTIKNTSSSSLPMWDDDFQGQWTTSQDTGEFSYPITEDGQGNELDTVSDSQFPAYYELAVDEEKTGELVFEVPADEKDFSISTMELFNDGTDEGEEGDTFFVFFTAQEK